METRGDASPIKHSMELQGKEKLNLYLNCTLLAFVQTFMKHCGRSSPTAKRLRPAPWLVPFIMMIMRIMIVMMMMILT